MTPEKLDRDSLSRLYALAKKAQELAYNSQNPQAVEDFNDDVTPDVVTALIDRVRELEGENAAFRKGLERIAKYPQKPGDELSYTYCRLIARAALERSEILNKE